MALQTRKHARKQRRVTRKRKHQRGGFYCNSESSQALFKFKENSCYMDSVLVSWIHAAPSDIQDVFSNTYDTWKTHEDALITKNKANTVDKEIDEIQKRQQLLMYLYTLYEQLQPEPEGIETMNTAINVATNIRNDFRDILSQCPAFMGFYAKTTYPKLTQFQDAEDFYTQLGEFLQIPEAIQVKIGNQNQTRSIYRIPVDTSATSITVQDKITSADEFNGLVNGTSYGILPIFIQRFDDNNDFIDTPAALEETLTLSNKEVYELVSIVVHTGASHYYALLKCTDTEGWMWYDDLQDPMSMYFPMEIDELKTEEFEGTIPLEQGAAMLFYARRSS